MTSLNNIDEPVEEKLRFFRNLKLELQDLDKVIELCFDDGNEIYHLIQPGWVGEDGQFDVQDETTRKTLNEKRMLMDICDYLPTLNKTAERYRIKAQRELRYCPTCQPYDEGSYIWIFGEKTTVEEIFNSINCPEKYRDDISEHLGCPNCGSSSFDRYDTVGTEDSYRIQAENHYNKALSTYNKKIQDFRGYLEQFPSLAGAHPLGRKIFKEISEKKVDSTKVRVNSWYRARGVDQSKVFKSNDLHAPPVGKSLGGRFHHAGQSVLYLADSRDLAMTEALENPSVPSIIWIQEYKLSKSIDNVLDLRYEWDSFGQLSNLTMAGLLASGCIFERVQDRNNKWKPQYFITTFIADCARSAGYQGILYSSSRDSGFNLVLFKNQDNIQPIGKPNIYIYEGKGSVNFFDDNLSEVQI